MREICILSSFVPISAFYVTTDSERSEEMREVNGKKNERGKRYTRLYIMRARWQRESLQMHKKNAAFLHFSDASFCTCHFLRGRSAIGDLQYPHRSTVHFDRPCLGTSALECCVSVSLVFFFFLLQISHRFIYLFFCFGTYRQFCVRSSRFSLLTCWTIQARKSYREQHRDYASPVVAIYRLCTQARGSCTELIPRRRTR